MKTFKKGQRVAITGTIKDKEGNYTRVLIDNANTDILFTEEEMQAAEIISEPPVMFTEEQANAIKEQLKEKYGSNDVYLCHETDGGIPSPFGTKQLIIHKRLDEFYAWLDERTPASMEEINNLGV